MIRYIAILLFLLSLYHCHTSGTMAKKDPKGIEVVLHFGYKEVKGELLTVTDSTILIYSNAHIEAINYADLEYIELLDVNNNGVKFLAGGALLGAAIYVTAWNIQENEGGLFSIITLSIPFIVHAFFLRNKKTMYNAEKKETIFEELKKYSRYPLGLSEDQLKALREHYSSNL